MKPLYLSHIALRDFRTFGRFDLALPPVPGLTLLAGSNGLGKSTFFDGIEWGLTGKVRRFEDFVGRLSEADYLTRRGAAKASHSVSLQFTDGPALERSATKVPAQDELIALLKDPDWTQITDLGSYLAFTHFLGQAAQQRFTSRKGPEQWEALKGPSGIDRLEEIRTALRGPVTANAFDARARRERTAIELAESRLTDWREVTERRQRIGRFLETTGVSSRDSIADQLDAMRQTLSEAPIKRANLGDALLETRKSLEAAATKATARRATLEALRPSADRHAALAPAADSDGRAMAAATSAVEAANVALLAAEKASQDAEARLAIGESNLASSIAEFDRFSQIENGRSERDRISARQASLSTERNQLVARIDSLVAALDAASAVATQAEAVDARRTAIENGKTALSAVARRAAGIEDLRVAAVRQRAAAEAAQSDGEQARIEAAALAPQIDQLRIDVTRGEAVIETLGASSTRIADALASIAAHIDDHETDCPVCASPFAPGELKRLARQAAEREDAELTLRRGQQEARVRTLDEHVRLLTATEQRVNAAASQGELAEAAEQLLAKECGAIAASLGVAVTADFASVIAERDRALDAELAQIAADALGGITGAAQARARVSELEEELSALRKRVDEVDAMIASVALELASVTTLLQSRGPAPEAELREAITRSGLLVTGARAAAEAMRQQHAVSIAGAAAARQKLETANGELARIALATREARDERAGIEQRWTDGGLEGVPSASVLEGTIASLATAHGHHQRSLLELAELGRKQEALDQQDELVLIETEMTKAGGDEAVADPARHEAVLVAALDSAQASLQQTLSARTAVFQYADYLKQVADEFSTKFLKPLNDRVEDFNYALLTTPGETVAFNARHAVNRTNFDMLVRQTNLFDEADAGRSLDPRLVLSEGQMAANGFSILCAASTAYRWSNWRALLLDDPLQHNDIIHAAAFTDVMRNLVEIEGYQLLMSSHDRAETEFLLRKFDAAGLPCTVVNLTAPAREGVRWEMPQYNGPASHAMQAAIANAS